MSDSFSSERLGELLALLTDELITDEQFAELDEILDSSAEAREWYQNYMGINRDLEQLVPVANSALESEPVLHSVASPAGTRKRQFRFLSLALIAAVLLAVTIRLFFPDGTAQRDPLHTTPALATVTHVSDDVVWSAARPSLAVQAPVHAGVLELQAGLVRLRYSHGVVVSLVGPVRLNIQSLSRSILDYGELAAYVPAGAEGFRVDTPSAKVTDLGTEFGVTVDEQGETELSVFDGEVEVEAAMPSAVPQIVPAGHAMKVDRSGKCHSWNLAPYKRARDSLRQWQVIWEPFGPGSPTGQFPGTPGAGWKGSWEIAPENGLLIEKLSGIRHDRPLHPGTESFLTVAARSPEAEQAARLAVRREFGSVDQFSLNAPYSIELLIRLESNPRNLESLEVSCRQAGAPEELPPLWQLKALGSSSGDDVEWQIQADDARLGLQMRAWQTVRCFVEVDTQQMTFLPTIAGFQESIRSPVSLPLGGVSSDALMLEVQATGKPGRRVRFSVDGIRIQSLPGQELSR